MNKLDELIKLKKISFSEAARQIGISRMKLWQLRRGKPGGRKAARLVCKWSKGLIPEEAIFFGIDD